MKTLLSKFDLKKISSPLGLEGTTLYCDVYFEKQKVAYYVDEARGGVSSVYFESKEIEKKVYDFLSKVKCAEIMHKDGWDFLELSEISLRNQFDYVVDKVFNQKQAIKAEKALLRKCKNKIIFGDSLGYREIGWKRIKDLADLIKLKGGLEALQRAYDKAFASGDKIWNTDKQLLDLGVKLKTA